MQKIFFTVLLVVTVLVTVRLHNYKQAFLPTPPPTKPSSPAPFRRRPRKKRITPKTRTTANSKKSTRKSPLATKKR